MNKYLNPVQLIVSVFLLSLISNTSVCQGNIALKQGIEKDSLSLQDIIARVVTTHPNIKIAEEAINNANARIFDFMGMFSCLQGGVEIDRHRLLGPSTNFHTHH